MGRTEQVARAGTQGKGDVLVEVMLGSGIPDIGVEVKVRGDRLEEAVFVRCVEEVLDSLGVGSARVVVEDYGAPEFAVRARTEAAVKRATQEAG